MPETIKKHDFAEIEFIGRDSLTGEVFDSNIKKEAEKLNPKTEPKPLVICVGEGMTVKGFDKAIEGKELNKTFKISIAPEEAFGKRNSSLVKIIPKKVFIEHKLNPIAGMTIAMDNSLAKIISASGGRILVDFNNPLAGKSVEFEFLIKRKVTDIKEKVNAIQDFLIGRRFDFDLDEKNKKIIFKELQLAPVLNVFRDRFKDLIGFDVEIFEKKDKREEQKQEPPLEKDKTQMPTEEKI